MTKLFFSYKTLPEFKITVVKKPVFEHNQADLANTKKPDWQENSKYTKIRPHDGIEQ
jgi:hypothetical protein